MKLWLLGLGSGRGYLGGCDDEIGDSLGRGSSVLEIDAIFHRVFARHQGFLYKKRPGGLGVGKHWQRFGFAHFGYGFAFPVEDRYRRRWTYDAVSFVTQDWRHRNSTVG